MQIVITALGSRGDVQPYLALALGLREAGYRVRLVASRSFRQMVEERGIAFAPVEVDVRALLEENTARAWLETGRDFFSFIRYMREIVQPRLARILEDCWNGCQGAQAIVYSPLGFPGYHIAEGLGVPCFPATLQPMGRTRAFPSVTFPGLPLGGAYNWLTHLFAEQLAWQSFRGPVNRWRRESLGLPPLPFAGAFGRLLAQRVPNLFGYSPAVVPKPADWPAWYHVTGYWFLDHLDSWKPPEKLVDFLASGPPPVYVGIGSMRPRNAEAFSALAVDALRRAGKRGVLLVGWAGLGNVALTDDVLVVDEVPHDWLFPRMATVVHHGGAGTAGAALRAGTPMVVLPFFADQPFWAQRAHQLGVAPPPLPHKGLAMEMLAEAIRVAAVDEGMQARAAAMGQSIRAEDGVGKAVAVIRGHLAGAGSS